MSTNKERATLSVALFFSCPLLLAACLSSPKEHLEELARHSLLNQPVILQTSTFNIMGWGNNKKTSHVNIYIEGDGQSWQDPWTVSIDPSPLDPVGFQLALVDARPDSTLYLARPCQYIMDHRCTALDWTSRRFSQNIIDAYHEALDQIKASWKAETFTLHAYSGGATVALLVATSRSDIKSVVTFAPLLDPVQWTGYHHYSPLVGSLSPLDRASQLKHIPQEHFIGLKDEQVPYLVSTAYFSVIPESGINIIHKIPDFTHHSDWPHLWKSYILKKRE